MKKEKKTSPSRSPVHIPQSKSSSLGIQKKPTKMNLETKFNKNNMIVAVRSRPLSKRELDFSNISTITISNREVVTVMDPLEYNYSSEGQMYLNEEKQMTITKSKEHQFAFDFAFDEKASQEEVYHYTTEMLLKNVIDGFNATVLAYGATGSGKTYTMVGNGEQPGVMIRSISDLFTLVDKERKKKNYNIQISYIEVYNEQLKDLLCDSNGETLSIRHDPNKGIVLMGAEFKTVTNANDAFKLLISGNKRRREEPTVHNENSSRSHAILQINLEIKDNGIENEITFGKFILVDLAGSEKITTASKQSSESGSINRSLLALANCINMLVSQNKANFIPWRDSKLTRILKDSLSGNSRIVMIAAVSPSIMTIEETLYTLQYANRAKNLKIKLTKNVIEQKPQISKYEEIIKTLRTEINDIKGELIEKEKAAAITTNNLPTVNTNETKDIDGYQNEIINHFQEEIKTRKEIIDKEREIENIKNEIAQNEYELNNPSNSPQSKNATILTQLIAAKKSEIEKIKSGLTNLYTHQGNLITKRKDYQKFISKMANMQNSNYNTKSLINIYKYYIALLENMTSEHRKYVNLSEIRRKDQTIEILSRQLDYRDKYILNAGREIQKVNGVIKYQNDKFLSADEIELNPYKLPVIKVVPDLENSKLMKTSFNLTGKNNFNININTNSSTINPNSNTKRYYNIGKIQNPKILNQITLTPKVVSTHRQYQEELIPLIQTKNPNKFLNKFQRLRDFRAKHLNNIALPNALATSNESYPIVYNRFNNYRSNRNLNIVDPTRNYPIRGRYGSAFQRTNNSHDRTNSNSLNRSYDPNLTTNTSRLENEVQKKVKTILAKDFIGRYKRSPYLRNWDN